VWNMKSNDFLPLKERFGNMLPLLRTETGASC
jgi:hypothetical protein